MGYFGRPIHSVGGRWDVRSHQPPRFACTHPRHIYPPPRVTDPTFATSPPLSTALDPLCPSPLWVPWCPPRPVEEVRVRLGSMGPNSIRVGSTKPYCAHRRHGRRAFLPRAVRGTRKRREKETWWKEGWTKRGTSGSTEGMERRKQERETKGDTRHWCSGACVLIDGCHRQRLETRKIRRRGSERGTTDRQVEAGGNSNPMRSPTRPRSERRQDFHQESVVPAASW